MATPLPDLDELTAQELALLDWQVRFRATSRVKQRAPNETHPKWKTFGICCGRGFGKSFSGSNWLGLEAAQHPNSPWAVVAPTLDDVRETNFEGPAGLLNAIPEILIADYIKKPTSLTLWNGARIRGFAGDSPDRMRGPQHWGAYCLAEGTLIATRRGQVPIEQITTTDEILTRKGYRRVLASMLTHPAAEVLKLTISAKSTTGDHVTIYGTMNHRFYTPNRGFIPLGELTCRDRLLCFKGSSTTSERTATSSGRKNKKVARSFGSISIARFMRRSMVRLIMGLLSTISTTIRAITRLRIYILWGVARTLECISPGRTIPIQSALESTISDGGNNRNIETRPAFNARRSIAHALSALPAHSVRTSAKRITGGLNSPARFASVLTALRFIQPRCIFRNIAPAVAMWPITQRIRAKLASWLAPYAERNSFRSESMQNTAGDRAQFMEVRVAMIEKCLAKHRVYDITVAEVPEFFANGILVHNCDEVASYKYMKDALSNLRFGLRLGPRPRMMWTSTPRPRPELKELIARTDVLYVGTTYENRANLAESFFEEIQQYEGTRLGRQEIHGELINMEEMGIVRRSDWNLWPAAKLLPPFEFIIMSLDTATTEKTVDKKTHDPDYTACSVWGVFDWKNKMNVMLLDAWQERLGLPELIDRVKRESKYRYGNQDVPLIKPTYLSKPERSGMGGRPIDMILIERQGAGRSLVQMLAQEEVLAHEYNPGRADKLQRLHIVSRIFSHKRVWAVESDKVPGTPKQWAQELITQVCTYAGEGSLPHDDAMDSCVTADTKIITLTGPKPISEITLGERVLTHKGNWKPVTQIMRRQSDHYYRVKAKTLEEIKVTGNHPAWVSKIRYMKAAHRFAEAPEFKRIDQIKPRSTYTFMRGGKRINSAMASVHDALYLPRVSVNEIDQIDLMDFPDNSDCIIKGDKIRWDHGRSSNINRYMPLNEKTGYVCGLFIAEGCIVSKRGIDIAINWACNEKEIKKCASYLKSEMGIDTAYVGKADYCWVVSVGRKPLVPLFLSFRKYAESKIIPEWVYSAPADFIRGFLSAYSVGDGHTGKDGCCVITSTSYAALWGLRILLGKIGVQSTIAPTKQAGLRNVFGVQRECLAAWGLSYQTRPRGMCAVWRPEGASYFVEYVTRVDEPAEVWNLSVADDESYATTGGTLHNCTQALRVILDRFTGPMTVSKPDPDETLAKAPLIVNPYAQ